MTSIRPIPAASLNPRSGARPAGRPPSRRLRPAWPWDTCKLGSRLRPISMLSHTPPVGRSSAFAVLLRKPSGAEQSSATRRETAIDIESRIINISIGARHVNCATKPGDAGVRCPFAAPAPGTAGVMHRVPCGPYPEVGAVFNQLRSRSRLRCWTTARTSGPGLGTRGAAFGRHTAK